VNFYCRGCGRVIVGSQWCPFCETFSTFRSASEITIEVEESENRPNPYPLPAHASSDGLSGSGTLKRRRESPATATAATATATAATATTATAATAVAAAAVGGAAAAPPTSYALFHTLGRCQVDPFGGDGAFSEWMQRAFSSALDPAGCVAVERLAYTGPVGNVRNSQIAAQVNPALTREFDRALALGALANTDTIILNWHLRFTGTPNGFTGRGINKPLVKSLKAKAAAMRKRLIVLYTVHEYSGLRNRLVEPHALLALNRDVTTALHRDFAGARIHAGRSRVPGLMTSFHTTALDTILRYAEEPAALHSFSLMMPPELRIRDYLGPIVAYADPFDAQRTMSACLMQQLRIKNVHTRSELRRAEGIVIFGMITERHGLSAEVVKALSDAMDRALFPRSFKIIIAGKTAEEDLAQRLRNATATHPRVDFTGRLGSFNDAAGARYAISFDHLGYRDNASAMVNLVRAGHLLFSRRSGESDTAMIARAVRVIGMCEANEAFYIEMLSHQDPRLRASESACVLVQMDQFMRRLALSPSAAAFAATEGRAASAGTATATATAAAASHVMSDD